MRDKVVQQKGTDKWPQPAWKETGPAAPRFCAQTRPLPGSSTLLLEAGHGHEVLTRPFRSAKDH